MTQYLRVPKIWINITFITVTICLVYVFLIPKLKTPANNIDKQHSDGNRVDSSNNRWSISDFEGHWLDSQVTIVEQEEINSWKQTDKRLINYLKARHLSPPSKLPYHLNGTYTKGPQDDAIVNEALRKIFKDTRRGFFVECGAYDGIASNTIFLEQEFQWRGLLIECNPVLIPELRKAHRRAYVADVCIAVTDYPSIIDIKSMDKWPASSSVGDGDIFPQNIPSTFTRFEVPAFPIYSIIAATGAKEVDFITLDVQSIEWKVIKHFPFSEILVKVWIIEVVLLEPEDKENMKSLMKSNDYRDPIEIGYYKDYLFVHNTMPLDPSITSDDKYVVPPAEGYRGRYADV